MTDRKTLEYFDSHTPEYGEERLARAAGIIRRLARPESSLVEIGCGTGNVLHYLGEETGLKRLCGVDVSSNCLDALSRRMDCERRRGSILDEGFVSSLEGRFDFAVMAAVLHHLVGRTRRESRGYALQAVDNALRTLKPGGHLIVSEPVFHPALAMDLIFYLKKAVTSVSSSRVQFLGEWNNIGAPVVSYLTADELVAIAGAPREGRVAEVHAEEQGLHWLARLALIRSRQEVTVLIRKNGRKAASGIPPPPVANPSGDPSRRG